MKTNSKYSMEAKIKACQEYETTNYSYLELAEKLGISDTTMRLWYLKYKEHGPSVFKPATEIQSYSKEFKISVLEEYELGKCSVGDLAIKYNLSKGVLSRWRKKWYTGMEIKDHVSKGDTYTMKTRKTTFEERLEVVKWIIDNNMSYKGAVDKYGLNYALVYKWTQAYIIQGPEGIRYKKRGPKPTSEIDESNLSEIDLLKLQLEREKALRKRKEFELEVLKKKEAFEQQLRYPK